MKGFSTYKHGGHLGHVVLWFLFPVEVSLPLGTWDGLPFFIVALPGPSVNYFDRSKEEIFEGFFSSYIGITAILVMWPASC